jgi:hypothetical protein
MLPEKCRISITSSKLLSENKPRHLLKAADAINDAIILGVALK